MAIKWTPARNERLLLLVVQDIRIDASKLAKAWNEQFGDDDFQPTTRAIQEQFTTLKKKAGGKGGAAKASNGVSTPKTSRTTNKLASATKKSPTKSVLTPSKRKRANMSDEDDESGPNDDDDSEIDVNKLEKLGRRSSLARTRKVRQTYEEPDSQSEKADDESDELAGSPVKLEGADGDAAEEIHVACAGAAAPKGLTSKMSELTANGDGAEKKTAARKLADDEMDDDSDVSDFAKSLG